MDAIAAITARIPLFQGYAGLESRRVDDELIRSYVGERLAALSAAHPEYFAPIEDEYESTIIRAGFMNQVAFHAFEYVKLDGAYLSQIAEHDLALLDLADRAETVTPDGAAAYLDALVAAFDRRDAEMKAAAASVG